MNIRKLIFEWDTVRGSGRVRPLKKTFTSVIKLVSSGLTIAKKETTDSNSSHVGHLFGFSTHAEFHATWFYNICFQ